MASTIAKKVGGHYIKASAQTLEPSDPHYEEYVDAKGKTKKRKRAMPDGLTKQDAKLLKKVRRRAHYLDRGFSLCGFRFGWTAILGLIPFLGQIVDFLLAYKLIIRLVKKSDCPKSLTDRMYMNVVIGVCIGVIPLAGDIFYAVWKPNSRNAALLEEYLIAKVAKDSVSAEAAVDVAKQVAEISKKTGEKKGAQVSESFLDRIAGAPSPNTATA